MRYTVLVCLALLTGCGPSLPERGLTAWEEGSWNEVYRTYGRLVRQDPCELDYRRRRVGGALRSGQLPDHIELVRDNLSDDHCRGAGLYELALSIAIEGEPQSDVAAIELLAEAAELLPQQSDVVYRIGLLRLEQEAFCRAVEPLERASELSSESASYRVALAGALEGCGQADRVREVLRGLTRLHPSRDDLARARAILAKINSPMSRVPRGLRGAYRDAIAALAEESSPGQAVQLIEEVLIQAPDCAPVLTILGLAHVRLGQLAAATIAFERSLELWPEDPTPRIELAAIAEETGDLAEAEEHLQAALEVSPLEVDAWSEIGRIRYQSRRYEEASQAFEQLVALDGGTLVSQLWLARSLRRAHRETDAERVYQAVLESHPRTFEACVQLGHIYRERRLEAQSSAQSEDLLAQARRYYRLALDIRPQDPMVQRLLDALEE